MLELKCLTCIHEELCLEQKGGVDLHLASDNDCKCYKSTNEYKEVKHGKWISASPCGYYDFYCSCCKEFAITYEDSNYRERYHLTDYCPFCGAIMDGGKAE